ncbi:hypothetical protein ACFSOZ_04725 [Mesorhizobium newzealandense]|uniref:Uncharacterized protein n=1 Tax=Mesorhizobium newzealandense TaxID=1300302 RepID=A0ABW4U4M5_9HYPH
MIDLRILVSSSIGPADFKQANFRAGVRKWPTMADSAASRNRPTTDAMPPRDLCRA